MLRLLLIFLLAVLSTIPAYSQKIEHSKDNKSYEKGNKNKHDDDHDDDRDDDDHEKFKDLVDLGKNNHKNKEFFKQLSPRSIGLLKNKWRLGEKLFVITRSVYVHGSISSFGERNLQLQTNGTTRLTVMDTTGFVGIGITDPTAKLDVDGDFRVRAIPNDNDLEKVLVANDDGNLFFRDFSTVGQWRRDEIEPSNISYTEGDVAIGTIDSKGFKLGVAGRIITEGVKVEKVENWSDFVFEDDYYLIPLDAVNDYITENKHLPGIPSAEEVKENGINLEEMDAKLLQKIEELTLYVLQLKKEIEILQTNQK